MSRSDDQAAVLPDGPPPTTTTSVCKSFISRAPTLIGSLLGERMI
jgi:hypothetical protein